MTLQVSDSAGRAVEISGEATPEYLWDTEVVDHAGIQFCASMKGVQLHCSGEALSLQDATEALQQQWNLFLKPHYGTNDWVVTARQPLRYASMGLNELRELFPLMAIATLVIALLLSSFEVRRAHRPLVELLDAFRGMSRGRFPQLALEARSDEYGSIGRAFNKLSRTLRRQFRLLSTFERMDQVILARPDIGELVSTMLPRLPQMLDCQAIGLFLDSTEGGRLWSSSREQRGSAAVVETTGLEAARSALQAQRIGLHWDELPIRLKGQVRGVMFCGRGAPQAMSPALRRQAKGVARRFAVALRNEEREGLLVRQAYYDALTELPNRRLLLDRMQKALADAALGTTQTAVLYLDIDRFKTLNDSLGHRAGDDLLKHFARRLALGVGPGSTVSRLGGDEFAVIVEKTSVLETSALCARLLELLQETVTIGGIVLSPQTSIGVAMFPEDGTDADTLLRNADAAMYRAKAEGGNRTVFFEEKMNQQAIRRLKLESSLRRALAQETLRLVYQPKIELEKGGWVGVEALLRWTDPQLGEVSPVEFIPIAEDSGLIHDLGRFVLRQAIGFGRRCMDSDAPIGHIAVNVSMLQLRDNSLVHYIESQLREQHLPPGMLQIEVTESALMQDPDQVASVLTWLRQMGVRVAIDDFGTGYSSLAVLQKLPVGHAEDRPFVRAGHRVEQPGDGAHPLDAGGGEHARSGSRSRRRGDPRTGAAAGGPGLPDRPGLFLQPSAGSRCRAADGKGNGAARCRNPRGDSRSARGYDRWA